MRSHTLAIIWTAGSILLLTGSCFAAEAVNEDFDQLAGEYVDRFPSFSPVGATQLGDHRFDGQLDEISEAARAKEVEFNRRFLGRLNRLPWDELSRDRQVDAALLKNELESQIWRIEVLQEWAWNPLVYAGISGGAIYGLMAREFAPLEQRLKNVADRLERMPAFFSQVRKTLIPTQIPKVHAETAIRQNRGLMSILDNMVAPETGSMEKADRKRLEDLMAVARKEVDAHEAWLKETVLPSANGDFRVGAKLFDQKLKFTLHTPLNRLQIRERANSEFKRVREEMYEVSKRIYLKQHIYTQFPEKPSEEYIQSIIRSALEVSYQDIPEPNEIVAVAKEQVKYANQFLIDHEIVTPATEPLEVILMPEFRRGVSFAYCDAPGPLDRGLKTYYAVSPIPDEWTPQQVKSFLREYNIWSMHDLSMHEAIPGHYLQLAHSNQYPSPLRAILSSGPFVEGWAVYSERVMVDAGYLEGDDRMRLINLKWYLRGITNAMIDQAIHVDGMTEEESMHLMIEGGFQEEREAAGKWIRAQLTSAQLSTYFVGTQEHWDMRRSVEQTWGSEFSLKKYHDTALSFGSPPVQFVKALLLNQPIPR